MGLVDVVVLCIVAAILGGCVVFIVQNKKKGNKCIGCPDSCGCAQNGCAGCSGTCNHK